jgi:hypothetical protein
MKKQKTFLEKIQLKHFHENHFKKLFGKQVPWKTKQKPFWKRFSWNISMKTNSKNFLENKFHEKQNKNRFGKHSVEKFPWKNNKQARETQPPLISKTKNKNSSLPIPFF